MSRKKKTDAEPSDTTATLPETNTNGTPEKRRPVQSFRCFSDGTTCIEVAIWGREVEHTGGSFTQYSLTISRTWRDPNGTWHDSGKDDNGNARLVSFRVHDLPILIHLIQKAHAWQIDQRVT